MRGMIRIGLVLIALCSFARVAWAQDPHLTGDFNQWSTASGADPLPMLDDGVAPDAAASDGIYTRMVEITNPNPGTAFSQAYKILPGGEFGSDELGLYNPDPAGNPFNFVLDFGAAITTRQVVFTYDSNDRSGQGWSPGVHFADDWTTGFEPDATARSWVAAGSFQHLVGGTDWNPASTITVLHDDGLDGDAQADDGIYTYRFTAGVSESGLEWKVVNQQADFVGSTKLCPLGWAIDGVGPGDLDGTRFSVRDGEIVTLEFDAVGGRVRTDLVPTRVPLQLAEVGMFPMPFIEIANPNPDAVSLESYYLSDRADYFQLVTQLDSGDTDFVVQFPAGATVPAGGQVLVALDGAAFLSGFGFAPDFEILATSAADDMLLPWTGALGSSAGLDATTETLTLFFWDGTSDLVTDSDYVRWGTPDATNPAVDKTGVAIDGPDGDADPATYLDETPAAQQAGLPTPATGKSIVRIDPGEGSEACCLGNGFGGHDETSENLDVTWLEIDPGPGCAAGESRCTGECVDVLTSSNNCGGCGVVCGAGESCCAGSCIDTDGDPDNCGGCGVTCGAGETCCEGACVDTQSDPAHCGGCGAACQAGESCCSGGCADLQTDESHCGGCGTACGAGESCCGGSCLDTSSDPANCGGCGVGCPGGQACCSGSCADLQSSTIHCGSCDNACAAGEDCCGGSCIDTQSDPDNCGACGASCAVGEDCCSGGCADLQIDEEHCGDCATSCAAGQGCCAGSCIDIQSDPSNCGGCGVACAAGEDCCTGDCADLQTDENHCGSCGNACTGGQQCAQGLCCQAGESNCGGTCADLQSDPDNCGSCGNVCAAGEFCSQGQCVTDCDPGLTPCGGSCVDLQTNPNHCGACDNLCSYDHAEGLCVDGICQMGACDDLWGDCNGNHADGCEKDLSSDVSTCGGCDHACSFAHAAASCENGTCVMGACEQGFEDCDGEESSGCEADLSSVRSCGSCDNVCAYPNAEASCQDGTCVMGSCDTGWGDCNQDATDGCETDLRSNTSNCGTCDNACAAGEVCSDGTCASECPAGQTNCQGTCADLMTSEQHCGNCGTSCNPGEECRGGVCTVPGYNLTGTVRSEDTREGLSGAVLVLDGGSQTASDPEGRYIFSGVEAGSHQIAVSVAGYRDQTVDVVVADADTEQDILMQEVAEEGCGCGAGTGACWPVLLVFLLSAIRRSRPGSGSGRS